MLPMGIKLSCCSESITVTSEWTAQRPIPSTARGVSSTHAILIQLCMAMLILLLYYDSRSHVITSHVFKVARPALLIAVET
eukprot:SAG22_NODE_2128_length_2969_cov_46.413937_3_plen_81_part_00